MKDKLGNEIKLGDTIKVRTIEKPDVVSVGPVIAVNSETEGMVAWTRDGGAIEKAHFKASDAELVHTKEESV